MEAFLVDEWLGGEDAIPVVDEASLSAVRDRARDVAAAQQMSATDAGHLASIVSELGRNQLRHAMRGRIAVLPIARGPRRGVEIIAADEGNGVPDPTRAMQGMPRAAGSMGVGIAAARDHAHELDFDVRLGEGTCIRARRFDGVTPARREVGIFGRPYRGEPCSGDHARFFRDDERLLVGVCDGLGHGPKARAASRAAMEVLARERSGSPQSIVEACHHALVQTRGAVMAIIALREDESARVAVASVGNITVELSRPHGSHRFGASSFVVGSHQAGWRAHVENTTAFHRDVLVVFTDGVGSRASIEDDLALLREHPIVIAHQLVERFAREDDDALVVVAK